MNARYTLHRQGTFKTLIRHKINLALHIYKTPAKTLPESNITCQVYKHKCKNANLSSNIRKDTFKTFPLIHKHIDIQGCICEAK